MEEVSYKGADNELHVVPGLLGIFSFDVSLMAKRGLRLEYRSFIVFLFLPNWGDGSELGTFVI
jgi:hypothetical protein